MKHPLISLIPLATVAALCMHARPAEACGGTFCDAPGQQVDQTGEVIAFVIDGPMVEAHIQIQYNPNTEADQFAWVVPVQQVPSFRVGSDPLFQNLLAGTVPTYVLNTTFETCGFESDSDGTTSDPTSTTGFETDGGTDTDDEPPQVVLEETVGAFDVVVLEGGTVDSLLTWLADNGYQQDPASAPIFQEYLDEDYKFVAFRLTQNAEVDAIHPVVLTYEGNEPCVPIRLTRIAAEEDMEIRAFFLGNNRTVPSNYRHVLVNHVKIDWLDLNSVADQYKELITLAVDAFQAEGHAFVTEYAGDSSVVQRDGIYSSFWDASGFAGSEPADAIDTLSSQGLVECFGSFCNYYHPLLQSLLNQYLPIPDGMTDAEFYSCLECFPDLIDVDAWGDGSGFGDAFQERIIDPGQHATQLLDTWPYLTRMYTTISPAEMTEDPMFHQNPSLETVNNRIVGNREILCNSGRLVTVPPGREIYLPPGQNTWPEFPGEMPYTHEVQTVALEGAPQTLVDNDPIIVDLIEQWNSSHGWPFPAGTDTDTDTDTTTSGTDTSAGTDPSAGPSTTDAGTSDSATGSGQDDEGCGCTQTSPAGGALAFGVGLTLLAWTRRRERT